MMFKETVKVVWNIGMKGEEWKRKWEIDER